MLRLLLDTLRAMLGMPSRKVYYTGEQSSADLPSLYCTPWPDAELPELPDLD